jgi:hypothetical protein
MVNRLKCFGCMMVMDVDGEDMSLPVVHRWIRADVTER